MRESWIQKVKRIRGPLTLITLGSLAVALYFYIMAVYSFVDGTYRLFIMYAVIAATLTALGPFLVYKGLTR